MSKSWKIFILVLLNALFCAFPHINIKARRYAPISKVPDMEIMDSLFNRYRSNSAELLYYTVSAEEEGRMSMVFIKNEDSVMCWHLCGEAREQKLSRVWAYKAAQNYSAIFDYRFKDLCGVAKSETGLAFVPPLNLQKIIVYKSRKKCYYFENEEAPASYTPEEKNEKYRKEWSCIILRAVKCLQTEKAIDDDKKNY